MAERDRLFAKHPKTTFIARALRLARERPRRGSASMFDEMPNVYAEVGAMLYDLGRQPRAAHDFFVKYQDRILFGKDSYQPDEYPYYWRVFETNDEYFDYYRDYHAFWKLYGIGLPDAGAEEALLPERAASSSRACRRPAFPRTDGELAAIWPPISSPAAPASSDRTSPKNSSGAATASASSTA